MVELARTVESRLGNEASDGRWMDPASREQRPSVDQAVNVVDLPVTGVGQYVSGLDLGLIGQAVEISGRHANNSRCVFGAHQSIWRQPHVHGAEQHDTVQQLLPGFLGRRITY